jgi:hypothetical protein
MTGFEELHRLIGGRLGVHDVPCPWCSADRKPENRRKPVLRIWHTEPGFLTYRCAHCDTHGFVREHGTQRGTRPRAEPRHDPAPRCNGARALDIWRSARSIARTPAALHLERRGLVLPDRVDMEALRFALACPFGDQRLGCLVALVRDITTDAPIAIHRTALTPDGTKIDRKALGPIGTGAIKLAPDEDVTYGLTVGEGLETVIAGMMLGYRPAWSLIDAHGIDSFPVLASIDALTILVDNDASRTGQEAALACSKRWTAAGREVFRVIPTIPETDINDVVRRHG